jgi:hypothetical protein
MPVREILRRRGGWKYLAARLLSSRFYSNFIAELAKVTDSLDCSDQDNEERELAQGINRLLRYRCKKWWL